MTLAGRLEDVSPVDVLEVLSLTEQSGTLHVAQGGKRALVGFASGDVLTAQVFPQYRHLTSYFVKRGWLDFEVLHTALQRQSQHSPHELIGQILLDLGALSEQQLLEGLQQHARVVIGEIARWSTGSFRFDAAEPAEPESSSPPQVGIALSRGLLKAAVLDSGSNPPARRISLAPRHGEELTRLVEEVIRPSDGKLLIVVTDDLLVLYGIELALREYNHNAVQLVEVSGATQMLLASDDERPVLALDLDLMARRGRDSLRVFHILRKLRSQWPNLQIISFGRDVPEAYYSFLQHGHVSFHLPRPNAESEANSAVIHDFVEALAKVIHRASNTADD